MAELPEEYKAYLKENLNLAERVTQSFSAIDERIDYTNKLLTILVNQGGGQVEGDSLAQSINALILALTGVSQLRNPENFRVGVVRLDAAGTAQNLENVRVPFGKKVVVKAFRSNLGSVYVGNTQADAEGHGTTSYPLWQNEALELEVDNLQVIWIDADNTGEGVVWVVEQESAWIRSAAESRYGY